eukprot:CAMPEP_0170473276 /NCGR_PEP_ID=MMETSP0123-20130129/15200_1 /TAXON_ID=182087 /ORGANISM="Favella ehrenbergii, Strain Fehren 1" /LENGTH=149 /DNA_ID=CAMNT_0010742171 /DNA_START=12 /DNA_END=461 /DNA_ORIENTATION=+
MNRDRQGAEGVFLVPAPIVRDLEDTFCGLLSGGEREVVCSADTHEHFRSIVSNELCLDGEGCTNRLFVEDPLVASGGVAVDSQADGVASFDGQAARLDRRETDLVELRDVNRHNFFARSARIASLCKSEERAESNDSESFDRIEANSGS